MTLKNTMRGKVLTALAIRPRTNAELCEIMDDISPCVARTMSNMAKGGLSYNCAVHKGRGRLALYAITPKGRQAIEVVQ